MYKGFKRFQFIFFSCCIIAEKFTQKNYQLKPRIINQNESAEIFLYGIIGRWMDVDTNKLVKELEALKNSGTKQLTFYVNSDGGEVIQGQTLWAYLDRSEFNVTFVIDGIAASIMAMILTNPKHKVIANRYSKFMYHRIHGAVDGNSDEVRSCADMMEKFEADLIEMFAVRTGMDAKRVKKEFFGNTDKWLNAYEALDLKLVDEIRDSRFNITEPNNLNTSHEVFAHYNQQLINCLINPNFEMKNIAKLLNLADNADEAAIQAAVSNIIAKNQQHAGELAIKDKQISDLNAKIQEAQKQKVKNLIDGAIAEKRFGEDMRATYTEMAEENFERAEKVINSLPTIGKIVDQLGKNPSIPETEKAWTWDDYHKANKLENLKSSNPARFADLYKAKFNREYKD